ncbi:MAG: DNA topoisomerase IV subunit A [Phycisphaerales bacterium]|nr:DNA topoisomerase IV subunit A [Phycisphaerales bacterium]
MARMVVEQIDRADNPTLNIPVRSLSNVAFNEKKGIIEMGDGKAARPFFDLGNARRFMQTMLMSSELLKLQQQHKTTSIRDMFYHCKHTIEGAREETFDEQEESDPVIEDLEVTLGALREELRIFANPEGSMVGPMTIRDTGDEIELSRMGSGGWAVPSIVEPHVIQFVKSEAKFILLIEKAAIWMRFNEDRFWKTHQCMIIHGGGQPPRGVRRLCHRMANELGLPLYVLVDNDPWGYYIYSVVRQGSINLAFESSRMAVPAARFIGMSSFDAAEFDLSASVTIRLNDKDIVRAKEIMAYPWFADKRWQREIKHMLKQGVKLELEALSNKDFSFIADTYVPEKLKKRKWLD